MATQRLGKINIGFTVPQNQLQLYNALGRTTGADAAQGVQQNQGGGDNFFAKRGRSIENAFGTTGSAIASAVNDRIENDKTTQMLKDNKTRMNAIAKKYGYNTYHDVWDARDKAKAAGDTATVDFIDNTINPELTAQANENAAKANEKAARYEDYRKNDYISNKINQDRGKFAGSAINTLSTAVDVAGLGANPLSNAIQGGVEGLADELEQNGLGNFSWERAGQNALIGATTGAVTGALNKGISGSLAKRAAAKGLTNTATKAGIGSALKNGAKTIATGAARGALSGAVGGATGAGLQSALNNVEFGQGVQNALQGAVQGAQQGAVTGGIMAGANMAISKTPGVGKFYNELQGAKGKWDQSGSNFDERLTNTLTSGDSAVGDWLMNKRQSNVLGAAGNLGNRVKDTSDLQTMLTDIRQRAEKLNANRDDYGMPDESWRSDAYGYEELLNNPQTRKVIDSLELTHNPTAAQAAAITQYLRDNGYLDTPTTAKGWAKKAGQRIVEDINNKGVGLTVKDTSLGQYENDPESRIKLISEIAERAETLKGQPRGKYGTNSWNNDLFEYSDIDEKVLNTLGISGDLDGPRAAAVTQVLKEKGIIPDGNSAPTTANTVRLYRGLEQEYDPNYPASRLDTNGYESWTDNPELAKQYGKNVYYIDVPEADIKNSYLDENPNSPTYGDRYPLYRTTKGAGLNEINGNEYQLEVGSDYQKGLTYTPLEETGTPTTAKGWVKKAGQRIVDDINNSNLGNRVKDISSEGDLNNLLRKINNRATELDNIRKNNDPFNYLPDKSWSSDYDDFNELVSNPQTRQIIEDLGLTTEPRNYQTAAAIAQVLREQGYIPSTDTPTTAAGWTKKARQRIVEDINNSNLGNRVKDVSSDMPEDIRNMQIRDYNAYADGQDNSRPYEYIGANGKKALKIEMPILDNVPAEESSAFIKQAVKDLAQEGRLLDVGNIPELANISSNSAKKAGDHVGWNDTQLRQRNEVIADIDEVGGYLHNVRYEAPKAGSRDNVAGVIKGDVEVDINGEKIYPEVVYRLYDNGDLVLHDVTKINRLPSGDSSDHNLGRYVKTSEATRQPRDTSIVTQNSQNVNVADPWDRVAQEAGYSNYDEVLQRYAEANPNAKINPRGMAGQVLTWMDQNPNTPTTASGWAKRAGQRAVEDINNSNLGLRVQDVSQDGAQEAALEADNPQTRLYRMLAGGQASPTETITNAEYGESGLANRTKRGMVANALERTGNFLEGAQSNATRPQLKDLGIESAGKVIENVRKKTGITNLETQAEFAKELTGGADSLMDNVQRRALTESADGKPYTVDTSDIAAKVESIVDKYADANMFGSQSKRNQFISNLRRDISSYDTDVLNIANRMKANAADYRGKGVADPQPADAAKAKIYTEIANELEDLSYKAIPQENVDAMFDTAISEMQNRAAQARINGNNKIAKAYTKAANDLNNEPRTVKAFRSFKKDFVDVSKINQVSARAENGAATQMGRSFGSGMKRLTGTLLQRPVNAVLAKAGGAINTVADKIDNSGRVVNPQIASPAELANAVANYNPSTQLYNAIGRTEGALAQEAPAQYLANAAQEAEIVSPMEAPTAPTNDIATSMGNTSTATYDALTGTPTTAQQATTGSINTGYFQPTGDYWTDIIASAMSAAIDTNDVESFSTLLGMYQNQMANLQKQTSSEKDYSNPMNWSSADRTKLLSAQNAMGQIDQLEEAYNQATGGEGSNAIQGWLRSRASDISGGNWDPSASNYNSLAESVGMGIVKNLINLGVTEADAERYLKYIPALTDTKEQAAQKLDTLRNTYQNQINNLYGVYGL